MCKNCFKQRKIEYSKKLILLYLKKKGDEATKVFVISFRRKQDT